MTLVMVNYQRKTEPPTENSWTSITVNFKRQWSKYMAAWTLSPNWEDLHRTTLRKWYCIEMSQIMRRHRWAGRLGRRRGGEGRGGWGRRRCRRGRRGRGRALWRAWRPGPGVGAPVSRARGGSSGRHGGLGQEHALRRMEPQARSMVGGRYGRERKVREDNVKRERGKWEKIRLIRVLR
jgi:hypothetical protein